MIKWEMLEGMLNKLMQPLEVTVQDMPDGYIINLKEPKLCLGYSYYLDYSRELYSDITIEVHDVLSELYKAKCILLD